MHPFIPQKFEHLAFGLLLSCFMSLLISGVATFLAAGLVPGFLGTWFTSWLSSWAIAFPSVLVVAPFVRRVLHRLVIVDAT